MAKIKNKFLLAVLIIFLSLLFCFINITHSYSAGGPSNIEELYPGHNNITRNRLNIIFVGTGYDSIERFKGIAKKMIALERENDRGLMQIAPFNEPLVKYSFNFWVYKEIPPLPFPLTNQQVHYLLSSVYYQKAIEYLNNYYRGLYGNESINLSSRSGNVMVVLLANVNPNKIPNYGYSGGSFGRGGTITAWPNPDSEPFWLGGENELINTHIHELMHSIPLLYDEYSGDPNSSIYNNNPDWLTFDYKGQLFIPGSLYDPGGISKEDFLNLTSAEQYDYVKEFCPWGSLIGYGYGRSDQIDSFDEEKYRTERIFEPEVPPSPQAKLEIGVFEGGQGNSKYIYRSTRSNMMNWPYGLIPGQDLSLGEYVVDITRQRIQEEFNNSIPAPNFYVDFVDKGYREEKVGNQILFYDASCGYNIQSWNWDFGDGGFSQTKNPLHIFSVPGKYSIKLTVKDTQGTATRIRNNYIKVDWAFPRFYVSPDDSRKGSRPLVVKFQNQTIGRENVISYDWDFGDGSLHSREENPEHVYYNLGIYPVTLTIKCRQDGNDRVLRKENYIAVMPRAQFVKYNLAPSLQMAARHPYNVEIVMKNTDTTAIWKKDLKYRLGSQNPADNEVWGLKRVELKGDVAPGLSYPFSFWITAPADPGEYKFQWQMVQDGVAWFGDKIPVLNISVIKPENDAVFLSQSIMPSYYPFAAGGFYNVYITMKNNGTIAWTKMDNYKLGSQNPQDNTIWGFGRVGLDSSESVAPGQNKTFRFTIIVPTTAAIYHFQWQMLREGVAWFGDKSNNLNIEVRTLAMPYADLISENIPTKMTVNQKYRVSITLLNNGNVPWLQQTYLPIDYRFALGSQSPKDNMIWKIKRVGLTQDVLPGERYTFSFEITAPSAPGTYSCSWQMLQENKASFGSVINKTVTVTSY